MSQPTDYIVVVSNDEDYMSGFHHFAEKINRKLRACYQLHGQPFNMDRIMCQAMIKMANSENGINPAVPEASGDTTMFYHRADHA